MKFSTDFPGGCGKCISAKQNGTVWEIDFLAESKAGEPMPLWFFFSISEITGEKIILRLVNSSQCLGNAKAWDKNRPVYKFKGGSWKRLENVRLLKSPLGCTKAQFEIKPQNDSLEFAFCYPYQQSNLFDTLNECPQFEKEIIGYSNLSRPIYRLYNMPESNAEKKKGIYIIGRQHSGEVTGSWEIDGMLRYLCSLEGEELLNRFNWRFVPLADIDGVEEGYYGKDQIYNDFNRGWHIQFPKRTELIAVQNDIVNQICNFNCCLVLDMHSPSHHERDSYFVIKADTDSDEREFFRNMCSRLNLQLDKYKMQNFDFSEQKAGYNTSSQSGWSAAEYAHANGIMCCSVECSYQGENNGYNYSTEDYRKIGACILKAAAEIL